MNIGDSSGEDRAISTAGRAAPSAPSDGSEAGGLPGTADKGAARELPSLDYAAVASGLVIAALLALLLQSSEATHPLLTLPLLCAL